MKLKKKNSTERSQCSISTDAPQLTLLKWRPWREFMKKTLSLYQVKPYYSICIDDMIQLVITIIVRIRISYIFIFALYDSSFTLVNFFFVDFFTICVFELHTCKLGENDCFENLWWVPHSWTTFGCMSDSLLILILIVTLPRDRTLLSFVYCQPNVKMYI